MIKYISNFRLLHNLASFFVNLLPIFIQHNISKYLQIRFLLNTTYADSIEGDYCEFGCFTGAALNHAVKTYNKIIRNDNSDSGKMRFFGFDSFEGFPVENHRIFKSKNFKPNYKLAKELEKQYPRQVFIIKGFFRDSLLDLKNIKKIAIAFIDCDIYESAQDVFKFIKPRLIKGSYVMIDDCYNIDKNGKSIYLSLKKNFDINNDLIKISNYSMTGAIFRKI
jgi:hypothetical protein